MQERLNNRKLNNSRLYKHSLEFERQFHSNNKKRKKFALEIMLFKNCAKVTENAVKKAKSLNLRC